MMGCIRYGVSFVFVIGVDVYFVNFSLAAYYSGLRRDINDRKS